MDPGSEKMALLFSQMWTKAMVRQTDKPLGFLNESDSSNGRDRDTEVASNSTANICDVDSVELSVSQPLSELSREGDDNCHINTLSDNNLSK